MIHAFGSKENEYWVKKTPLHSKSNDVPILSLRKKQNFLGLGGAITKSSAYNYNLLDEENKKELINLYFSKNGLDYDLARISIGSNDFSPYVYDDMDEKGNINIKNEEDVCLILDEIKKIKKVTTLGSSWSPLTIWKDNGNKNNGGKLLEKCVDSCASYYVSVIKEFAKRGHPIDYFSPQNEPEARQVWECNKICE